MSPFASSFAGLSLRFWRLCNVLGSPGEEGRPLVQDNLPAGVSASPFPTYRGEAPITGVAVVDCPPGVRGSCSSSRSAKRRTWSGLWCTGVEDAWIAAPR